MAGVAYQTIVSQASDADGKGLAIAAGADNADIRVYVKTLDYRDELQHWELRARSDGAFAIINRVRGLCVARAGNVQGAPLVLADLGRIAVDNLTIWRNDNVQGPYNAINSFADWEQKINVPGNGPYQSGQTLITWGWSGGSPNELWTKVLPVSKISIKSIEFDIRAGTARDDSQLAAGTQVVTNGSGQDQEQKVAFRFVEARTYRFEREHGSRVGESIEFEAGLPIVGENRAIFPIEGRWTYSEGEDQTSEQEIAVEVPVTVPAHTSLRVSLVVLRGRLDVPYQAVFTYHYADGTTEDRATSGRFTGINGYPRVSHYVERANP